MLIWSIIRKSYPESSSQGCVEIDLSKPLKRGFWIGDDDNGCMMTVFYECLPVFCFKCGLVGHGEGSCPLGLGEPASGEAGEGAIVVDQFHGQQTRHLDIGEDASRASKMDS